MPKPDHQPADVSFVDATRELDATQIHWLAEHTGRACAWLGLAGEVRVRVVGDSEMTEWHARHLQIRETTDVLTFDFREPPGAASRDRVLDVDAVICLDEARRRAGELGHEPQRELLLYVVHAALHCVGYDDLDPAGSAAMHREEDRVLAAIGVGATYARGSWA